MAIFRMGGMIFSCKVLGGRLSKMSPDVKEVIRGTIKKFDKNRYYQFTHV